MFILNKVEDYVQGFHLVIRAASETPWIKSYCSAKLKKIGRDEVGTLAG